MKIGIVIYSTDPETVWNGFRFGVFSLNQGDQVKVFLMAKGVECEKLDTEQFKVTGQMQAFVDNGGKILACGTCLKLRHSEGTELCPLSTMKDLYEIVKESDKVVSF
ncbi:MAG: DsrE family protein [Victivallales bacterium]